MSKSSTEIEEDEEDVVAPKLLVAKFTSPTDGSMEELENEAVQNDQADAYEEGSTDVDAHTKPSVKSKNDVVQNAQADAPEEDSTAKAVQNAQADASEEGSTDVDAHTKPLVESNEYVVQDAQPVELGLVQVAKDDAYENDPHLAASSGEALDDASNSDGCNGPDGHLIDHRNESKQQWDGTSTNLIFVM